jgi:predicted AAA+ superfamily ATPase
VTPVRRVNRVDLGAPRGRGPRARHALANTRAFAQGFAANNALLWGARGMGKSSLVKAVHATVAAEQPALRIVEVAREDLRSIGRCLALLRDAPGRFVMFCDDLSFSHDDAHYKSLKAVLDGASRGGRRTWCSMPPRTGGTSCRGT